MSKPATLLHHRHGHGTGPPSADDQSVAPGALERRIQPIPTASAPPQRARRNDTDLNPNRQLHIHQVGPNQTSAVGPNQVDIPTWFSQWASCDSSAGRARLTEVWPREFASRSSWGLSRAPADRSEHLKRNLDCRDQPQQPSPRHASTPSRTASAAMTSAANGSAHHQPNVAFRTKPVNSTTDR